MAIQIFAPAYLHEKGRRKNNQDSILPDTGTATAQHRLFMVCDGVGGSSKGEVASKMVCELFHAFFNEHGTDHVDELYINEALQYTEQKLTEYVQANADAANMSTTLTLLYLDDVRNRAVVAWCGDSRVYHIRNGEILFMSEDHSLVQELVKRGEITAAEAQTHPQKNIILRAVSGTDAPTKADVAIIDNLRENDYFLLCSDGIMEGVDQRLILTLLGKPNADIQAVREQIMQFCLDNSKDNFSMYLIKLQSVTKAKPKSGTTKVLTPVGQQENEPGKTPFLDRGTRKILFPLAALAGIALVLLFLFSNNKNIAQKSFEKQLASADSLIKINNFTDARNLLEELQQKYPNQESNIQDKFSRLAAAEQNQQQIQQNKNLLFALIDSVQNAVKSETLQKLSADSTYFANLRQTGSSPADLDTLLNQLTPKAELKPEEKPKSEKPADNKKDKEKY
ncbi:serine/threonine-protein phosphatase [Sphingobacteriales bacterium UPWRP_1]|nr:hypothetical protein B6N25_17235 [Sphingobacteriales bacterium TSM_CSS]PSJ73202.1 serine/threonine-protein phosphatase [Sphingobacteriales bacterium UPWRP_1]